MPEVLYERVLEVDEEVVLPLGDQPDRYIRLKSKLQQSPKFTRKRVVEADEVAILLGCSARQV